ncbi:WD40-like protein [Ditylenchus destructor]|uniref:WD40-like protein n=1 Tax=Ditylenchus destructor TaxID=166010 RepID=A0AAD4MTT1_9BILA|nr:WD40-like protein [Ditylenchus destructor]
MSNYCIRLISLLILVNVLGLAQSDKKLKSKFFKKFTTYYTNWRSSHPRFSDDSRYVVFSRYEDGVRCPEISRISIDGSGLDGGGFWFTRLSPGFGVARNPSFAGSDGKHVIFESNIHKGPLKYHFPADEKADSKGKFVEYPCDDVLLCRNPVNNKTIAELCAELHYEIPPTMALYAVNQYGNLIAQLTGPNADSESLQYSGDATLAGNGKIVIFSGRCDTGICLYKFDYLPDDLKKADAKRPQVTKIDTSSLNEPNAAYGGVSFSSDGDTIVFHGYTPQPNNDTALQIFRARLDYGLFPITSTEIYLGHLSSQSFEKIPSSPPNVVQKLYPKFVPNTNNKKILYTAKLKVNYDNGTLEGYQLRMYDLDSNEDVEVTGVGDDYIEASDAAFNLDGTKLVFVINSAPNKEVIVRSIAVGEFYLPGNINSSNLMAFQQIPTEPESSALSELYESKPDEIVHFKDEKYFKNVRQLTFGGVNRKGYFKYSDASVIGFEAYGEPYGSDCSQIYEMNWTNRTIRRLSSGFGRSTIGPYRIGDWANDVYVTGVYASDFFNIVPNKTAVHPIICRRKLCDPFTLDALKDEELTSFCSGPTLELLNDSKVFTLSGGLISSVIHPNLPYVGEPYFGYGRYYFTAISKTESTSSKQGPSIVYKSARNDTYKRVTHWQRTGYKGGPVYNGAHIYANIHPTYQPTLAFHADFPCTQWWENITRFHKLFKYMLVDPSRTEIYVADESKRTNLELSEYALPNTTQLTNFGCASWGPTFLTDTFQILFTSDKNYCGKQKAKGSKDSDGNEIVGAADLFVIGSDGTGLEQITFSGPNIFDGDATLNSDGDKILWASTRNASKPGDVNLFMADWIYPSRKWPGSEETTQVPTTVPASDSAVILTDTTVILNAIVLFVIAKFITEFT